MKERQRIDGDLLLPRQALIALAEAIDSGRIPSMVDLVRVLKGGSEAEVIYFIDELLAAVAPGKQT